MMKVLHFIWSANFGGIEKLVIDLTEQQQNNKQIQSEILIGCNKGAFLHLIEEKKIMHHNANMKNGWQISYQLIKSLTQLMNNFDIIHLHTFNLPVMLSAIKSKKKIVYTIHGNFNYGKKIRITDRANNALKSYFFKHKVSFITFNSNWSKQEAIKKYRLKLNQPSKIIYNGINLYSSADAQVNYDIDDDLKNKFLIGTIARLNKSKKIERLIEAYSNFSKDKNDVRLIIIGDGIEKNNLQNLVHSYSLENQTVFTGYLENIIPYAEQLNLCVFPFQHEAFGLVVLEVFNLGKPVIIFNDSGGMKELFNPQYENDIVNSVHELTQRMDFYYQNKSQADPDAVNKRKKLASQYSIQKMENDYYQCYRELVS